jgi:FlaA1/EpsC-like NDP-sugar epimerase
VLAKVISSWLMAPLPRACTILLLDVFATAFGLYAAFLLRFAGEIPLDYVHATRIALPLLVALRLAAVILGGLHRWAFRTSGLADGARLVGAMVLATVAFVVVNHEFGPEPLPRTVYALEFFITVACMAGFRFAPRLLENRYEERQLEQRPTTMRALIVGADQHGDLLARDLTGAQNGKYLVVGFVDDAAHRRGMHVCGKPVLGVVSDLPRIIHRHRVSTVLLANPELPAEAVRRILEICATTKASFKAIPASYAYLDKRISAAMLHDLSPDDLLARDPVQFDYAEIRRLVRGRSVLVTGAGGTIGGEICRQLAAYGASRLVMVDMNENELYLRSRTLQVDHPGVEVRAEVADVRELTRLRQLGERYRPHYVFHAAAHKHVPLMEDAPEESVKNNVFGTLNVARMADQVGAERLVVISTDKAVNPTSVMGATKRIAELITHDVSRRSATQMTAVRFGNVLGSAGSVVPLFKQQIERGGPVTVTHPECTRFFMTVSEAVGLVLLAGLGGYGELCVLDMGKPVRIAEMAAHLITMAGRIPGKEIAIVYTGLRPGEKLNEELLTGDEEQTVQVRNRISVCKCPPPPVDLERMLTELRRAADAGDRENVLAAIGALVPSYRQTPGQAIAPVLSLTAAAPAPESELVQGLEKVRSALAGAVPMRAG